MEVVHNGIPDQQTILGIWKVIQQPFLRVILDVWDIILLQLGSYESPAVKVVTKLFKVAMRSSGAVSETPPDLGRTDSEL